ERSASLSGGGGGGGVEGVDDACGVGAAGVADVAGSPEAETISPASVSKPFRASVETSSPSTAEATAQRSSVSPTGPGKRSANTKPQQIDTGPEESMTIPSHGPAGRAVWVVVRTR